jgi:hypothetical protein
MDYESGAKIIVPRAERTKLAQAQHLWDVNDLI